MIDTGADADAVAVAADDDDNHHPRHCRKLDLGAIGASSQHPWT
uniref:Uncharacterized protein n=1 Tax=Rhizophora mucronata TaxID=61149 RepID=A0A2P2QIP5_RHIMU